MGISVYVIDTPTVRRQIQTNKMLRDKTFFHILYPILSIYNIQAKHNYTQLLLYYLRGGGYNYTRLGLQCQTPALRKVYFTWVGTKVLGLKKFG